MEIFVLRDGQQTGPFNEETIQTLYSRGGLAHSDMAWHKGLPGWIPLGEVLKPGSERPTSPPPAPVNSGVRSAPKKGATAKQKALLKYIGASFEEAITKEEAAVAISDAMESPKFSSRFQKWGEERLKLHPDLFQDEIDHRRANRVARYLERCQTDGAEAVKDVTKAHVQVLVESLDKRNPTWERDSKAALWDHLLPTIAEHFPQLVQEGWKQRLKPGLSKVAAAMAAQELPPVPSSPGAFSAALRGLVYGGVVLGLILGGNWLYKNATEKPGTTAANPAKQDVAAKPAEEKPTAPIAPPPVHPTEAPLIAANPVEPVAPVPAPAPNVNAEVVPAAPANPPVVAGNPDPSMAPAAPAPNAAPAAPMNPAVSLNTPPAPAPGGEPVPNPVPVAPATPDPTTVAPPAGPKNVLTVTKAVAVQLQFGKVTLNPGTRVRFIALEGQNVRVNFNNNVILIPALATDVDPNALPPAPATVNVPQPAIAPAPAPAPAPAATPMTPPAPKPSSDF